MGWHLSLWRKTDFMGNTSVRCLLLALSRRGSGGGTQALLHLWLCSLFYHSPMKVWKMSRNSQGQHHRRRVWRSLVPTPPHYLCLKKHCGSTPMCPQPLEGSISGPMGSMRAAPPLSAHHTESYESEGPAQVTQFPQPTGSLDCMLYRFTFLSKKLSVFLTCYFSHSKQY